MTHWMLSLFVVLITALIVGSIAERVGQSRVIGEIASGLLLGASVLGGVSPELFNYLFVGSPGQHLKELAELGVIILMFEVAWHAPASLENIAKKHAPIVIAVAGIVFSFSIGCVLAYVAKPVMAPEKPFFSFILFCGLALSITALPVLVRIIRENTFINKSSGSIALASAVCSDMVAWAGVAVISAMYASGYTSTKQITINGILFLTFIVTSLYVVSPIIRKFKWLDGDRFPAFAQITIAFSYCLLCSEISDSLGFNRVTGAIVAGYTLSRVPGLEGNWKKIVGGFSSLALTPVFFAYSGIQASLSLSGSLVVWLLLFFVGSLIGKLGGCYLGARIVGLPKSTSVEVGVLMNTKGLVELVVLNIGLEIGVVNQATYSVLLILALVSTGMTIPVLNWWYKRAGKSQSAPAEAVT
ncbi:MULTISPECIES: cation:proton antiporter [Pseudomonas]|nr:MULTISPECIES: cation:proton antiporter [Pseudomonas]MBP1118928.1 Kef-type K+ transport system membrane component KefB [Pseudomonas sp. PvP028]MBP1196642.1 Kef-type K+ transport system membrane component KefB [Pseudomonas sp. PvP100]MBS7417486.1 cation:proton antiporter [Pseudomonas syringae]RMN64183.1 Sodium/hydrogen exchanger [Pseudomonas syringae]UZA78198.1 hypothetical protein EZZ79_03885 [Pseudomonas syringae]